MLIALSIPHLAANISAQTKPDKITPEEYIEANEFARNFWAKFIQTKDIRPLLTEFAVKDFYNCLDSKPFVFLREDQIRPARVSLINRYYVAETNFFLLFLLWTNSTIDQDEMQDIEPFSQLPKKVKRVFTKRTFDAIEKNDLLYDSEKPQSEKEANEYFDQVLIALEKADPVFRKEVIKIGAGRNEKFQRNMKQIEEYNDYAFRPELSTSESLCMRSSDNGRLLIVDVPFFQLSLSKVAGRLRILEFPFHVD